MPTPQELKTELTTDPASLGYAALIKVGSDGGLADALNLPRSGASFAQFRSNVAPSEILHAVAPADFANANQLAVSKLQLILAPGVVDASLANVRGSLQALFSGASQATRDALLAVCTRQGSRAEKLFGPGTTVTPLEIAIALRG